MKKVFNLRPIFLAFVGVFVGAYFAIPILFSALYVKLILAFLVVTLFGLSFIKINFIRIRKIAIIIFCASLVFGFGTASIKVNMYNSNQFEETLTIEAIATDSIIEKDNYTLITLRNLKSTRKLSGKMKLYIYGAVPQLSAGSKVKFKTKVKTNSINDYESAGAYIERTDVKYFASISEGELEITSAKPNIFENIRIKTRSAILKNVNSSQTGELIYASLFGDRSHLSSELQDAFKSAGAMHLLAVSGLNIGFIVAILAFIMKGIKARKEVKLIVTGVILLVYNFLCGFNPSVVRATITAVVFLLAVTVGEKGDMLTALGLSGLSILIFKPLMALDVGFQLSFSSVFGIICLYPILYSAFLKIKIPKMISSTFAVCLSATIGTIPFMAMTFKSLSYVSPISNIVLVPLFGVSYIFSFLVMLISSIFPFMQFLYFGAELLFFLIIKIVLLFIKVPALKIVTFSVMSLLVFPALLFVSNVSFAKAVTKKIVIMITTLILIVTATFSYVPANIKNTSVSKLENDSVVLASSSNEAIVLSENFSKYEIKNIEKYIEENRLVKRIKAVIVTEKIADIFDIYDFCEKYKNITIYVPTATNFQSGGYNILCLKNINIVGGFDIQPILTGDYTCAVMVSYDDLKVLVINTLENKNVTTINALSLNVDVVFCNRLTVTINSVNLTTKYFIASFTRIEPNYNVRFTANINKITLTKKGNVLI